MIGRLEAGLSTTRCGRSRLAPAVRSVARMLRLVEAYFKSTDVGPSAPRRLLIRYALRRSGGWSRARPRHLDPAPPDRRAKYALNSRVRILGDMHDCAPADGPHRRSDVQSTGPLDEAQAGELGTYVVNT